MTATDGPVGSRFEPPGEDGSEALSASELAALKAEILALTRRYARSAHRGFRPGDDPDRAAYNGGPIPYAGRVFREDEVEAAVASSLDFWLTLGAEGDAFEQELAAFLGVRSSLLVNSGSSANLVALSALMSPLINPERRLRPGDEVITCAAGFPTTVAPILQNGCTAVFVDADPATLNTLTQAALAYLDPGEDHPEPTQDTAWALAEARPLRDCLRRWFDSLEAVAPLEVA
jgi:CDP-6-deoxy-D-xylo-4-hexulose-3-dehydrase